MEKTLVFLVSTVSPGTDGSTNDLALPIDERAEARARRSVERPLNIICRTRYGPSFVMCMRNPNPRRQTRRYLVCFFNGRSFAVPVAAECPESTRVL